MKYVWVVMKKEDNSIVALYSDKAVAERLLKVLEEKVEAELFIEKRTIDQDLKLIGVRK